ncbi:MAG: haloacid dehalogenase type II [Candidatus Sulfotelmatobacter sp.]
MLDLSRFDTLTFDCYGTLIDWETGILVALHRILSAHGKTIDDATLLKRYADFEQLSEEGEFHPYKEVLQSVARRFGADLGFEPTDDEARSLPDSLASWKPWPDTIDSLQRLKKKFRLAIISNVDDDLFAATRTKLHVEFDELITAQQARAYKPSLKIFELALSRLGTPRNRILHIGQSIFHDVIPAQALGLATVWVNRPSVRQGIGAVKAADAKADWEITTLSALLDPQ